ncbi:hypothetical protein LCGC14_1800800 [marine sediment metagenome]|uniref:Uncharacterized protein n=1 Tax=marine sediment metagenome TaxID=412755 RepID=A0A0F9HCG6_9ZZZZ
MNYINHYKLIRATQDCKGGYLDRKELMSTINRHQIMKRIEKTNPECIETGRFIHMSVKPALFRCGI